MMAPAYHNQSGVVYHQDSSIPTQDNDMTTSNNSINSHDDISSSKIQQNRPFLNNL